MSNNLFSTCIISNNYLLQTKGKKRTYCLSSCHQVIKIFVRIDEISTKRGNPTQKCYHLYGILLTSFNDISCIAVPLCAIDLILLLPCMAKWKGKVTLYYVYLSPSLNQPHTHLVIKKISI